MATNINVEHNLQVCDDSGISSVAVCVCGRSWIGVGAERCRMARFEHALHVYDAGGAIVGSSGRLRVYPEWDETPNYPTPARGKPAGPNAGAERREQIRLLAAGGRSAKEIAVELQLGLRWVQKTLSAISQEN